MEASGASLHLLRAVPPPLAAIAQTGVRHRVDPWQARKRAIAVHFSVLLMSLHSSDNCGCSGKFSLQRVGASHVPRHSNFELLLHLNSKQSREKMNFELERHTLTLSILLQSPERDALGDGRLTAYASWKWGVFCWIFLNKSVRFRHWWFSAARVLQWRWNWRLAMALRILDSHFITHVLGWSMRRPHIIWDDLLFSLLPRR